MQEPTTTTSKFPASRAILKESGAGKPEARSPTDWEYRKYDTHACSR